LRPCLRPFLLLEAAFMVFSIISIIVLGKRILPQHLRFVMRWPVLLEGVKWEMRRGTLAPIQPAQLVVLSATTEDKGTT
jgi:hypothetical protein